MNRKLALLLAVLAWALPGAALPADRPLRQDDFAWTMRIAAPPAPVSHLRLDVPLAVYRGAVRADLGDLRVFNAAGEVVPHALVTLPPVTQRSLSTAPLVFFPLQTAAPAGGVEGLEIIARTDAAGTVVEVHDRGQSAAGERLVGYLLDMGESDRPPGALLLDWEPQGDSFLGSLRVEASDDLRTWRQIAAAAPLARLAFGGQTLLERRVPLSGAKAKYLRLSWPASQPPLVLTAVTAEYGSTEQRLERVWVDAVPSGQAQAIAEYPFELRERAAVDRLRLNLPEPNTVVAVSIASRARPQDPWRPVTSGVAYRLKQDGGERASPDIAIAPNSDPHWLVRVDQRGGGLGPGPLRLAAGFVPQQVVFVARGGGPFQLAYGSAIAGPADQPVASLVPGYDSRALERIVKVHAADPVTAGGERKREPPPPPTPWRRYALWAVLVAAVGVLGWMAHGLLQRMKS